MVLEIAAGTFASAIVKGVINNEWLGNISAKAVNWVKKAGKNILSYLNQVKGGAFDWAQSDASLMAGIKSAIEGLYNPLGAALGRSVASVIVGGAVKNVPKVRINVRQLANLIEIHDGNESVKDALMEAVANVRQSVKAAGQSILFKMSYMNIRKYAAKALGKEDEWGKEAPSFTFAAQFEEGIKIIIPNEKGADVAIEGFEEFFDTLGDLLGEEDVYTEFI
ncbi:hypothetical protein [Kamptonema sp. UHCC 0994]|uniref:hypothetical protein n=1 Tax=Kamptonema sp. UHCC 0994 TaxID=3031329 RepID=UPI0023B9DD5F|nr:hypothetical protein [Kamptonema sp. UHCC 0994]MDF0551689.1 hypothetical protein [Kamptonema sp. UHCC 0994]